MGATVTAGRSRKLPEPEINITPLVDVVLVLLIIFMVVAPELEHGERVDLPGVLLPDTNAKAKLDPITVTVTARETLHLEKERIESLEALQARLTELKAQDPERRIILKGDVTVPYGKMRETFAMCQKVGFSGISLSVGQRGKGTPGEEG
jgi:biopolymer transport protein ExbD/biopolymer transport protein TolR